MSGCAVGYSSKVVSGTCGFVEFIDRSVNELPKGIDYIASLCPDPRISCKTFTDIYENGTKAFSEFWQVECMFPISNGKCYDDSFIIKRPYHLEQKLIISTTACVVSFIFAKSLVNKIDSLGPLAKECIGTAAGVTAGLTAFVLTAESGALLYSYVTKVPTSPPCTY